MDLLLLDSEGLSHLYRKQGRTPLFVEAAETAGVRVATTAMTVIEADGAKVHQARISWVLSHIDVHPITREIAMTASTLLRSHNMSEHKYAIDATLAAVALGAVTRGLVTVLTSDPVDLTRLCEGSTVRIVKI
ncbi:hypothetical protein ABIA39_001002 [Nocardia sp. GAS34]|uniref:DNA-binding protein n=1 Tax=unclassified Nocardia TaxID=2637762 RepID=UPI003D250014